MRVVRTWNAVWLEHHAHAPAPRHLEWQCLLCSGECEVILLGLALQMRLEHDPLGIRQSARPRARPAEELRRLEGGRDQGREQQQQHNRAARHHFVRDGLARTPWPGAVPLGMVRITPLIARYPTL